MKVLFRLSLIGSIAVLAAMFLWSYPIILAGTGFERPPEAMLFGYTAAEARPFFEALTDAGRAQYQGAQAVLDWAFPALVALMLICATLRWGKRVPLARRLLAIILALAAMGVDYWENTQIAAVLALPVDQLDDAMIESMSLATQGKTYLGIAAFLVTGGVVIGGLIRKRRRRKS